MIFLYLIVILLPLCAGAALALMKKASMKAKYVLIFSALAIHSAAVAVMLFLGDGESVTLFKMTEILAVSLKMDGFSKIFLSIASFGFLLAGIYAVPYMAHSERADSFFSFYLLSLGALSGMDLSANLITMYLFFEAITLLSMPLVLHDRTAESVRAALKYLFYSVAGAFLALCAIFFLAQYASTLDFTPGGALDPMKTAGRETLLRVVIFLGIVGFGAKAGMYPLHGWLPTAHPVAPAPASAVLSGIIAKAGVLAILRLLELPLRHLGAVCALRPRAADGIYGLDDGLPRKELQKTPRVFLGQPDFLRPDRFIPDGSGSSCGRNAAYRVSRLHQAFALYGRRIVHCQHRRPRRR